MEKYDILTLENNKDYVINEITNYNGHEYLLLVEVDDDENILDEKLIVELIKTNDGFDVEIVDDKDIYEKVSNIFIEMINNDLELKKD